MSDWEF